MLQDQLSRVEGQKTCPTAILINNNRVLTGLRNYTPDKWKSISVWTTPGGRCDEGETIEETLRREINEEVGIDDVEITDFIGEAPGVKEGDSVPVFLCRTGSDAKLMEPEKFSEWRWVPLSEYLSGRPWNEMNPGAHQMIKEYFEKNGHPGI